MPSYEIVYQTFIPRDSCKGPNNLTLKIPRAKYFVHQTP